MANANVETNALLGRQAARFLPPPTLQSGQESFPKPLISRLRLNILFTEKLMGLLIGWTHPSLAIESSAFEQSVIVWSRLLEQQLSAYFTTE